ncbi:MAG: hypothetical protein K6E47_10815 [Lachnospiraceae bacterium]|nr:hypothetical protein [Lachnospiraceae bacterium]
MKKDVTRSIVFITVMVMILSLTACGGDNKDDSHKETNSVTESEKKGVKASSLKPGDEVADGDKAMPGTNKTLYGGAVVGDSDGNDTKAKGTEIYTGIYN